MEYPYPKRCGVHPAGGFFLSAGSHEGMKQIIQKSVITALYDIYKTEAVIFLQRIISRLWRI